MNYKSLYLDVSRQLLDVVYTFSNYDSKARNFGTDYKLSFSEIHMLEFIGNNNNTYVSQIADYNGITKGAVSQSISKLEKKGYLYKIIDDDNKSREFIRLTEKGKVAYDNHIFYHDKINKQVLEKLNKFSENQQEAILLFLKEIENEWK